MIFVVLMDVVSLISKQKSPFVNVTKVSKENSAIKISTNVRRTNAKMGRVVLIKMMVMNVFVVLVGQVIMILFTFTSKF